MTQDELTLVLDALKFCHGGEPCGTAEAIAVVEKALANVATNDTSKEYVDEMQKQRHEQEPVAWVWVNNKGWLNYGETPHDMFKSSPLYPHPQRTWVGLTDEEIDLVCVGLWSGGWRKKAMQDFAKAFEAKLKEKNGA
jgi:hypothetical protein